MLARVKPGDMIEDEAELDRANERLFTAVNATGEQHIRRAWTLLHDAASAASNLA